MKKLFLAMLTFISTQAMAQTLEKMSLHIVTIGAFHITDLLSMTLLFITIRMAASLK